MAGPSSDSFTAFSISGNFTNSQYVNSYIDCTGLSFTFATRTGGSSTAISGSDFVNGSFTADFAEYNVGGDVGGYYFTITATPAQFQSVGQQIVTFEISSDGPLTNTLTDTISVTVQSGGYHGDGTIAGTIVAMHSALTDTYSALGTKGGVIPSSKTLNALPTAIQTLYSSATPNQSKSITIVENGTTTVIPDSGYVMSAVNVTTSVPVTDVEQYRKIIDKTITSFSDSTIATIGDYAFFSCINLTTISIPNCTRIGNNTFNNCSSLTAANFPKCTFIGSTAFSNCRKLTTVSFPSCTSISGSYAFQQCYSLTTVSFPSCTSMGNYTFCNCYSLTTVSFPVCTSIGNYAFCSCYSLTTASFPVCTSIGNYAFCSCSKLIAVNFPSCKAIGSNAFTGCVGLTTVSFPSCSTIAASAFRSCSSLSSAYFPNCSYIGNNAFRSCFSLATLNFPVCSYISSAAFESCSALTSVTGFPVCSTIGSWAFCGCVNLVSVEFPLCTRLYPSAFNFCASLTTLSFPVCTSIGSWAFQNDYGLLSANFPACTFIDTYAFYNCSSFSELHINTSNCVLSHSSAFFGTIIANRNSATAAIYVPSDYVTAYRTKTNWAYYSVLIKAYTPTPPASGYSVTFPVMTIRPIPWDIYVSINNEGSMPLSTFISQYSENTGEINSLRIISDATCTLSFTASGNVHVTSNGEPALNVDISEINTRSYQFWSENPSEITLTFSQNITFSGFSIGA